MATNTYAVSSSIATQPSVFVNEAQTNKVNLISGVGAVAEAAAAPAPPSTAASVMLFGT